MFARRTQFDDLVDRATSEMQTSVDWQQNMVICDLVSRQENGARDAAAAIVRRLAHKNPIVLNLSISLAEACVKNCGLLFHREVASRNFMNPLMKLVTDRTTPAPVREKVLLFLQDCVNEFRYDPSLNLVDMEFQNLKRQGVGIPQPPSARKQESAKDLQKEEEELQLALALSISEAESKKAPPRSSPDISQKMPPPVPAPSSSSGDKSTSIICSAKALYDFGGTGKGEIGFKKGDILEVTEKSDANWWKGYLRGNSSVVGLFPVNYVEEMASTKSSSAKADSSNASLADPLEDQINEESVNRLLELLRGINPQKDNIAKNEEIQDLFQQCNEMRPKVLELVIKYEKKKEELLQLNELFIKAKASYERLLAASVVPRPPPPTQSQSPYQQQPAPQQGYAPQYPPGGAPAYGQPTSASPGYAPQYPSQYPPKYPSQERGQANPNPQPQYTPYSEPPRDPSSPMRSQDYPPTQSFSPQPAPYYPPSTAAPPPQEYPPQSHYAPPTYPPAQAGPPSYDPSAPPPSPSVYPRESPYVAAPSTFQELPPTSYSVNSSYPPPQQPPQQGGYLPPQTSQPPPQMYSSQGYGAPNYANTPSPKPQPEVSLIDLS